MLTKIASTGVASVCVLLGCGCATSGEKASGEKMVTVVVGAPHFHSLEDPVVSIHGVVHEVHKTIGVTARFGGEGIANLASLSILDPNHGVVQVPRRYFENIELFRPDSLGLAYKLSGDGKSVGEFWVQLDFGKVKWRSELSCKFDYPVDPVYSSFYLYYDSASRQFAVELKDPCGNPISAKAPAGDGPR